MKQSIVVFDGDCGICKKSIKLISRLDWLNKFTCQPLQDKDLYRKFPNLDQAECLNEIKLIQKNGKIYGGGDAVIKISFALPLLAPFAWILWLPGLRNLVNWAYPKVARNRHCLNQSCKP